MGRALCFSMFLLGIIASLVSSGICQVMPCHHLDQPCEAGQLFSLSHGETTQSEREKEQAGPRLGTTESSAAPSDQARRRSPLRSAVPRQRCRCG